MKIYLVQRTDYVGYDETAGCVVIASDEEAARGLARQTEGDYSYGNNEWAEVWDRAKVEAIGTPDESWVRTLIVLTDFRAG